MAASTPRAIPKPRKKKKSLRPQRELAEFVKEFAGTKFDHDPVLEKAAIEALSDESNREK